MSRAHLIKNITMEFTRMTNVYTRCALTVLYLHTYGTSYMHNAQEEEEEEQVAKEDTGQQNARSEHLNAFCLVHSAHVSEARPGLDLHGTKRITRLRADAIFMPCLEAILW